MKYLSLFITTLATFCFAMIGDWQSYDISNLSHDASLKNTLDTTLELLLQENENDFPSGSNWHITKVYSIEMQLVNGINYRFKVGISNLEGKGLIVTWIVNSQPWKDQNKVLSWQIDNNTQNDTVAQESSTTSNILNKGESSKL